LLKRWTLSEFCGADRIRTGRPIAFRRRALYEKLVVKSTSGIIPFDFVQFPVIERHSMLSSVAVFADCGTNTLDLSAADRATGLDKVEDGTALVG
jgi:hypothetical protein